MTCGKSSWGPSLPLEVQHQIIRLLDPIALIALSQTDKHFRRLIHPRRSDFLQRLLALECLPEYGFGTCIFFTDRFGRQVPCWSDHDAWQVNRWACSGCLRLLPHTHFDNRSLLREANRKPVPGSPVAHALTSWAPSLRGKTWGGEVAWLSQRAASRETGEVLTKGQRQGYKRCWRQCNECSYQSGQIRPWVAREARRRLWQPDPPEIVLIIKGGTLGTPIRKSRFLCFPSITDRYFPGLLDLLSQKRPPLPIWNNRRRVHNVRGEHWPMMMVRCPGCGKWQEMRVFRFGAIHSHWIPTHYGDGIVKFPIQLRANGSVQLDDVRCHRCFLRDHGREALCQALAAFIKPFLTEQRRVLERKLIDAMIKMHHHRDVFPLPMDKLDSIVNEAVALETVRASRVEFLTSSDVDIFEQRHREFLELWSQAKAAKVEGLTTWEASLDFKSWVYNTNETVAHWRWVVHIQTAVKEWPDVLVDWALDHDHSGEMVMAGAQEKLRQDRRRV